MSTSAIVVRSALESDIDAVVSIERASFADPWGRDSFETALGVERMLFLVAEGRQRGEGGQAATDPVGVLGYVIVLLLLDEAEVADLAVTSGARGRGIGGHLLDRAADDARSRGVRSLYLEVRESNVSARALYESRSFMHVGRRRGYYRSPTEDALLLRRDLSLNMM